MFYDFRFMRIKETDKQAESVCEREKEIERQTDRYIHIEKEKKMKEGQLQGRKGKGKTEVHSLKYIVFTISAITF